ncbi:hypothetical protein [Phenylobacterium sp.]|uniref:hypothetical protein n=1 Tax=Phenylobacterium sp. TaxID=1871053 RepID=UPI002C927CCD|nr:hypothetical protein [Phenylobacterium sp.]HVI33638.1 hypothetical protein [Phenylobacterium sp.]
MSRIIAGVLAAVFTANALAMLLAGWWWYGAVPGVTATGPYNPHFVRDIGAAYLVTAAGLAWFAWRPREGWPALAIGAGFLTLHAAVHVYDAACGTTPMADVLRDLAGVYLPALLTLAIALTTPKETSPC